MKVTVLGTGTSTGVPVPGCPCAVCTSSDPKNKRLRVSVSVRLEDGTVLLIDTSPDLRYQTLRANITRIDAVLYTHAHADHIFGLDDLRCFNFNGKNPLPLYADLDTQVTLRQIFNYVFDPDPNYQGGALPSLDLNTITPYEPFQIGSLKILPLTVMHGTRPILGFRIGSFAYLTDCSALPDRSRALLHGLDTIIIDGLRVRPHPTHFTIEQAVRELELLRPRQGFLTHLSHDLDHTAGNTLISTLTSHNIQLAFDGLEIEVNENS